MKEFKLSCLINKYSINYQTTTNCRQFKLRILTRNSRFIAHANPPPRKHAAMFSPDTRLDSFVAVEQIFHRGISVLHLAAAGKANVNMLNRVFSVILHEFPHADRVITL